MKCFWVVSSLYSYIVVFSHWKILQKTIYFTGVPIEDEVNEAFLKSPKRLYVTRRSGLKNTSDFGLLYGCAYRG